MQSVNDYVNYLTNLNSRLPKPPFLVNDFKVQERRRLQELYLEALFFRRLIWMIRDGLILFL